MLRALMTFECGRNKGASVLLSEVDGAADHEGPSPADMTKLAREIKHAALPLRYALEFHVEVRRPSHHRLVVSRRREGLGTVFGNHGQGSVCRQVSFARQGQFPACRQTETRDIRRRSGLLRDARTQRSTNKLLHQCSGLKASNRKAASFRS